MDNDFFRFHKATASSGAGQCVEIAWDGEFVVVRDSKNPHGPVLRFSEAEWTAHEDGWEKGEFKLNAIKARGGLPTRPVVAAGTVEGPGQ